MIDRELLELAAKAAGMTVEYDPYASPSGEDDWFITDEGYGWNPLDDDGDALRLAVKIEASMKFTMHQTTVIVPSQQIVVSELHGVDPMNDTRRAIVRAAAEIGRRMQHE